MQANNITEVIKILDIIVEECKITNSPLGYFAVLYRKVTINVKDGIINNRFEDNNRMEKLDVLFANRYFKAYFDYKKNKTISKCWRISFKAIEKNHLVLQHLLTGINAHINLDLSIATVETVDNLPIQSIKKDFDQINQLLSDMVDEVKQNMGAISPIFKLLMPLAKQWDDKLIQFSIETARDGAWLFATDLSQNLDKREELFIQRDLIIENLGFKLLNPKKTLQWLLNVILFFESGSVKSKIETLEKKI
ncbi:DUF5995 family protein [Flavobacterium terrae]|uniref:Uncharacterized protein n=1 Tax=Flavobacterium terrae TaxID=415425 RepID=A0A1M6CTN8_9FLAO|nr:DUF5995 family protein [Flavobacterium terrae]SHI64231.1 hypothetical protein SAMN05444363_1084 [Flavobacterium terrae]